VAGAGRVDEQEEVQGRLQAALAGAAEEVRVAVTHDAAIALEAAFGSENGLVVIAGTGSVVFGRGGGGTTQRAGGWGHRLGDLGSGHAVGRAGLRAVAAALDGGPRTTLQARVQERYDIGTRAELLRWAYREKTALANVAPLVGAAAAAGDAVAEEILVSQTAALARQAAWVVDAVGDPAPHIAVLGGMLRSEPYAQALRQALRAQMPTASVERLQQAPVAGALRRAHQMQA
jgi:N-acetylglucosamine kinase-like BadF-type ATPase